MTLGAMQNYSVYPAIFDALTVNHILSLGFDSNVQKLVAMAGGSLDPALIAEVSRENEIKISTGDIATFLAGVSHVNGELVTSTGEIQYQQRADGGAYKNTSEHVTLNSTRGILLPRTISSSQDAQEVAALEFSYIPFRVGTNAPFVVNVNQALTGVPAVIASYKQGPIEYENTLLKDVQDSSTDFGLTFEHFRGSGDIAASTGSITKREPKMEFGARNLELANAIGGGLKGMTNGITQYYRNTLYADASNNHIAISLAAGTYEVTSISGSGDKSVDKKVTVTGTGQFSIDLAAAIPSA